MKRTQSVFSLDNIELRKLTDDDSRELRLDAIVEKIKTVPDGWTVIAIVPAWEAILDAVQSDQNALHKLPPEKLEELIAASYDRAGFDEVILTRRSGDFGRDIIATKKGFWSVRIIDQVKAYKRGHLVTAEDVRALVGVLSMDSNASKGVVTTTSDFAPRLKDDPNLKPLVPNRLELINGKELIRRMKGT